MGRLFCSTQAMMIYQSKNYKSMKEISDELYHKLEKLGMLPNNVRKYNIGGSDYAAHFIQPWAIWIDHSLNPFDADIIKRVLRKKSYLFKYPYPIAYSVKNSAYRLSIKAVAAVGQTGYRDIRYSVCPVRKLIIHFRFSPSGGQLLCGS